MESSGLIQTCSQMPRYKLLFLLLLAFLGGFLLNVWSPWSASQTASCPNPILEAFGRESAFSDLELERKAAAFIANLDKNYPATATESLFAMVMLHDRYGQPSLAGYQITSYNQRYIDALAILTTHLIKDSPPAHRERFARLRAALSELNEADIAYGCVIGPGSGCVRDRMTNYVPVEDAVARWALHLATRPPGANPDPRRSFRKIYERLANDHEALRERLGPPDEVVNHILAKAAENRPAIVLALDKVCKELKGWPPEVAEELSTLVLLRDFNY